MSMKVIIYTQTTCGPCHEEKLWLANQGISFEDRDIRSNDTYFNEAIQLGAHATPVTLIEKENGERSVVHGFDKDALKEALGIS